jgi:hypothetical protein
MITLYAVHTAMLINQQLLFPLWSTRHCTSRRTLHTPPYTLVTNELETTVIYAFIARFTDRSLYVRHVFKLVCLTASSNLCIQHKKQSGCRTHKHTDSYMLAAAMSSGISVRTKKVKLDSTYSVCCVAKRTLGSTAFMLAAFVRHVDQFVFEFGRYTSFTVYRGLPFVTKNDLFTTTLIRAVNTGPGQCSTIHFNRMMSTIASSLHEQHIETYQ